MPTEICFTITNSYKGLSKKYAVEDKKSTSNIKEVLNTVTLYHPKSSTSET
jgi:hypothetical protein